MGEHSKPAQSVRAWVWANRRKLAAGAIVALPLVARYVPGFPTEEVLSVLRVFLGA